MKEIKTYLEKKKNLIDNILPQFLPPIETYPKAIHEAMHYAVMAGGKRLRPILALTAAKAVGEKEAEKTFPLLCALEFIHTYTLIHDDLPAMDDDEFRRGKPSCHMVFGEGIAILAGDALLTLAFELLTKLAQPLGGYYSTNLVLKLVSMISQDIGTRGLVGGQVVDLISENKEINIETLEFIHKHKTGALFKSAMVAGGMLGGGTEKELSAIVTYAEALGLIFQITDDILDVKGDASLLGKATGSDEKKKKATYPSLLGLKDSRALITKHLQEATLALNNLNAEQDNLEKIIYLVAERSN